MNFAQEQVLKDLRTQQEIGVNVPSAAIDYVMDHASEIEEYRVNGLRIHEISDLIRDLTQMGSGPSEPAVPGLPKEN